MTFSILINRHSGRVLKEGRENFKSRLQEILGPDLGRIEFLSANKLKSAMRNYNGQGKLIIGGGDGTLATAASILGKRNIPFGILPLGTMNLFARDLGLPVDPYTCAALYKDAQIRKIDMASVNGKTFLCNTMLGAGVSLARQREAQREEKGILKWMRLARALIKKFGSPRSYNFSFHFDGQMVKDSITSAVIANNKYLAEPGPLNSLKKGSLTDGTLSLYTITTQGQLHSVAVITKLALGFWQNDPAIESFETSEVVVTNGKHTISILIDGELERLRAPLVFRTHPQALELLVPVNQEAA